MTASVLVIVAYSLNLFEPLELTTLDVRFRQYAHLRQADTNIVFATIDEQSLSNFKQSGIVWKWPRDFYAALVRYLHRGGAKVVVFDILFSDPDIDRISSDATQTDGAFAAEMQKAGNVVLASHFQSSEDFLLDDNPLVRRRNQLLVDEFAEGKIFEYSHAILPIEIFQKGMASLGAANYVTDPEDGVCRRLPLLFRFEGAVIAQLGLAPYIRLKEASSITVDTSALLIDENRIPLDENGNFLITWYGKGGPDGAFRYYSIWSLIISARDEELKKKPQVPSSEFKDKVVFVGSNAAGLFDLKNTPFTSVQPYPGMEISGTLLSNVLNKHYLVRVDAAYTILAIMAFSLVICLAFTIFRLLISLPLAIVAAGGWIFACLHVFETSNTWLDFVAPLVAIGVATAISTIARYQTEGRARRQIRATLDRYLSPVVVKEVLESPDGAALTGKKITSSILFSDIKDYTKISEKKEPAYLVDMLNRYFTIMSECVLDNNGLVDKYIGDAVMAVFGAPLPRKQHAVEACISALEMQRRLQEESERSLQGFPALKTRVGINTGEIVVGNIGSKKRQDYTSIGDPVNLASRLEGANKEYGTSIIISESTFSQLDGSFVLRPLDFLQVKGKDEPVLIYELIARRTDALPEQLELQRGTEEAWDLYKKRLFKDALALYKRIGERHPDDVPARLFIQRCEGYIKNPPAENWNGVHTLHSK